MMVGDLLASFCERRLKGGTQCLELWTYPDETLNVVVSRFDDQTEIEFSFPFATEQLLEVVSGDRSLKRVGKEADLTLELKDGVVRATVHPLGDYEDWQQQVPAESISRALLSA